MKTPSQRKLALAVGFVLALTAIGGAQFKQILKIIGVGAAVSHFGPDINKAVNSLTKHKDTLAYATKVVPIISRE